MRCKRKKEDEGSGVGESGGFWRRRNMRGRFKQIIFLPPSYVPPLFHCPCVQNFIFHIISSHPPWDSRMSTALGSKRSEKENRKLFIYSLMLRPQVSSEFHGQTCKLTNKTPSSGFGICHGILSGWNCHRVYTCRTSIPPYQNYHIAKFDEVLARTFLANPASVWNKKEILSINREQSTLQRNFLAKGEIKIWDLCSWVRK